MRRLGHDDHKSHGFNWCTAVHTVKEQILMFAVDLFFCLNSFT